MQRSFSAAMLAGAVLVLGPAAGDPALAQTKEYQPLGGRLGGFLVYPSLELQETYNDNIYTTNNGETDSWITRIAPSLVLQSDWNRHDLRFELGGEAGFYSHDSDDDYVDFQALMDSTIDVYHGAEIFIENLGYERLHEDRGSDEVPGAAAEVWEYSRYGSDGGVRYKPNRIGIELSGGYRRLEYDSLDLVGGGSVSGDTRDRDEFNAGAEIGYDFSPGYFAYVGGRYYWVDYDAATSFGFNRDSEGYLVETGVRFEATPLIDVDLAVGYREQDYESSGLNDVSGFSLRGEATWFVTALTTVGFTAFSEIRETTSATASGKLARGAALTVDHELLRNLVFDAKLAYVNLDYQGGGSNRNDDDFHAGLGATYYIGRNFYTGASYRFNMRESNASGEDYTQNVFMLNLGARF